MALVNVAELMYRAGLKVMMIDWDLEAPGLERFYPALSDQILNSPGVIDMLTASRNTRRNPNRRMPRPRSLPTPELHDPNIHTDEDRPGRLWLIPAGYTREVSFSTMLIELRPSNWQDFTGFGRGRRHRMAALPR